MKLFEQEEVKVSVMNLSYLPAALTTVRDSRQPGLQHPPTKITTEEALHQWSMNENRVTFIIK
jgi:hypothetical protein